MGARLPSGRTTPRRLRAARWSLHAFSWTVRACDVRQSLPQMRQSHVPGGACMAAMCCRSPCSVPNIRPQEGYSQVHSPFRPRWACDACAPKLTRSMSTRQSSSSTSSSVLGFVPAGLFAETGGCCIGKSASNSASPLLDVRGEAADDAGAPPDGDQLVSVNRERRRKSSVAVSFESVPLESSERSSGPS